MTEEIDTLTIEDAIERIWSATPDAIGATIASFEETISDSQGSIAYCQSIIALLRAIDDSSIENVCASEIKDRIAWKKSGVCAAYEDWMYDAKVLIERFHEAGLNLPSPLRCMLEAEDDGGKTTQAVQPEEEPINIPEQKPPQEPTADDITVIENDLPTPRPVLRGPRGEPKSKQQRRRHKLQAQGLCPICGKPPNNGLVLCDVCREKKNNPRKKNQSIDEKQSGDVVVEQNAEIKSNTKPIPISELWKEIYDWLFEQSPQSSHEIALHFGITTTVAEIIMQKRVGHYFHQTSFGGPWTAIKDTVGE